MNNSLKKLSLFAMLSASTFFTFVSYNLNKGASPMSVLSIFSADTAEGASCATVISCSNGTGTGSGTASGSGTATGTGTASGSGSSSGTSSSSGGC